MKIKEYWNILAEAGCFVCNGPANLHHVCGGSVVDRGVYKGKGSKSSDWLVIPLCHNHHQGAEGVHSLGVRTWEEKYGNQADMVDRLCESTGMDLWNMAAEDLTTRKKKKYNRPSKIVPRNNEY